MREKPTNATIIHSFSRYINEMHSSRSKILSQESHQAALHREI
jgi:hypothetical protein